MDFLEPYLMAMQAQAPALYRELRMSGQLEAHLKAKVAEAYGLFSNLTEDAPKSANGIVKEPENREAQEQVRATLIQFPKGASL